MVFSKSSKFNFYVRYLTMFLSTFPISDSSDSDKHLNQNSSMPAKLKNCPSKKCHCIGTFLWSQSIKNLKYYGQNRGVLKTNVFLICIRAKQHTTDRHNNSIFDFSSNLHFYQSKGQLTQSKWLDKNNLRKNIGKKIREEQSKFAPQNNFSTESHRNTMF